MSFKCEIIRSLLKGGRDLRRRSRMLDREGKEVAGSRGYKYFGAAKELPGIYQKLKGFILLNYKRLMIINN